MEIFKIPRFLFSVSIPILLMGCSTGVSPKNSTPALFDTKLEAERAAENFNCSGAHQMGDKWMPCKKHRDEKKYSGNGHQHNH